MQDLIPRGTGNSRWMKSSIPTGTTWEEALAMLRAGTFPFDLNGINSAGISQQGTALNKANLLSDAVAALYGLGSDAVPSDVLSWIGKYNQHWWRRRKKNFDLIESAGTGVIFSATTIVTVVTTQYSDSIIPSNDDPGNIKLGDPISRIDIGPYSNVTNAKALIGKYFYPVISDAVSTTVVYLKPDTPESAIQTYVDSNSPKYRIIVIPSPYMKSYKYEIRYDDWEYVQSSDRSAYPDSGEQGSYEYQYLGIPFDNSVTSLKIITGSYTGTGKYGSNNKSSLTFELEPKLVIISSSGSMLTPGSSVWSNCFLWHEGVTDIRVNQATTKTTVERIGNTLSWYSTSAANQLNTSGKVYEYWAIG